MTYRYNPKQVRDYYGRVNKASDGASTQELKGPTNPWYCYGYDCNLEFNNSYNIGTPVPDNNEPRYLYTNYPFYSYNANYVDSGYKAANRSPRDVVVMYSYADCIMTAIECSGDISCSHYDFSMCGKEVNLNDYDITQSGNDALLTKKSGIHDFPVLIGCFAGSLIKTDWNLYDYGIPSKVGQIIRDTEIVVDSDTTIRLVWSYSEIDTYGIENMKLFVNPIISPYDNVYGVGTRLSIQFIAPSYDSIPVGRIANW